MLVAPLVVAVGCSERKPATVATTATTVRKSASALTNTLTDLCGQRDAAIEAERRLDDELTVALSSKSSKAAAIDAQHAAISRHRVDLERRIAKVEARAKNATCADL